jgi:hypothetical protein
LETINEKVMVISVWVTWNTETVELGIVGVLCPGNRTTARGAVLKNDERF